MKILLPILALVGVLCLYMCTTSKKTTTKQSISLCFGSGGGFTGYVTQYRLHMDGLIEVHKTTEPEWKPLFSIDKSKAEQYLSQVAQLDLINVNHDVPDNQYFFLKVSNDLKENKIVWGERDVVLKKEIITLYKILNNHVREYHKQRITR